MGTLVVPNVVEIKLCPTLSMGTAAMKLNIKKHMNKTNREE